MKRLLIYICLKIARKYNIIKRFQTHSHKQRVYIKKGKIREWRTYLNDVRIA